MSLVGNFLGDGSQTDEASLYPKITTLDSETWACSSHSITFPLNSGKDSYSALCYWAYIISISKDIFRIGFVCFYWLFRALWYVCGIEMSC